MLGDSAKGMDWSHFDETFIQGLRDKTGEEVLMFQSTTLQEAMDLAHLQEEKPNQLRQRVVLQLFDQL